MDSKTRNQLITAPDSATLERLFKGNLTCKATYGTEVCGNPAQWKIIMRCCGASDFLCAECYHDIATTPDYQVVAGSMNYFQCHACNKMHLRWKDAVKEAIRI